MRGFKTNTIQNRNIVDVKSWKDLVSVSRPDFRPLLPVELGGLLCRLLHLCHGGGGGLEVGLGVGVPVIAVGHVDRQGLVPHDVDDEEARVLVGHHPDKHLQAFVASLLAGIRRPDVEGLLVELPSLQVLGPPSLHPPVALGPPVFLVVFSVVEPPDGACLGFEGHLLSVVAALLHDVLDFRRLQGLGAIVADWLVTLGACCKSRSDGHLGLVVVVEGIHNVGAKLDDLVEHVLHAPGEAPPVGQHHQRQLLAVEVVDGLGRLEGRVGEPDLEMGRIEQL